MDFSFRTTPVIVSRDGASDEAAPLLAAAGCRHVLIVTDAILAELGLLDGLKAALDRQGLAYSLDTGVQADPPQAVVEQAVEAARRAGVDGVIGFGGGSAMDTAKLIALLVASPQPLDDIFGVGRAQGPRLPLVQVPTTAGTGSEVTPIAIITTPSDEKKGVVADQLYPDAALLDATLTVGLPPRLTAMTGIDAIVHAVEAYTSRLRKNPVSDALALKALALLSHNLLKVVDDGSHLAARQAMLQGSLLAGMAFANAPVAAVHALAYPLGGLFHVPHGLSNALVFSEVAAFNLSEAAPLYGELAGHLPAYLTAGSTGPEVFVEAVASLVRAMPMEQRLSEVGVTSGDIDRLAVDAMKVERLLVNNPREVTLDDARAIYRAVL